MKTFTDKEIEKLGRIIPLCGVCYRKFKPQDDFEWVADCEHHEGVIAHIGAVKGEKGGK